MTQPLRIRALSVMQSCGMWQVPSGDK